MPIWFWQEFTSDMVSERPDVFMFGEWIYSHPLEDKSVEFANLSGMSILDFGLCTAIRGALGNRDDQGFQQVAAIFDNDGKYRSATELVTFFENHDMPRLQSLGLCLTQPLPSPGVTRRQTGATPQIVRVGREYRVGVGSQQGLAGGLRGWAVVAQQ